MKSLHQFLFYLIYGYQGDPNLDQTATIKSFEKKDIKLTEDEIGELSRIYVPEISWKMFVPKLPFHLGIKTLTQLHIHFNIEHFLLFYGINFQVGQMGGL